MDAKQPPTLEAVRARIDAIDAELLRLVDERAAMAVLVAEAKRAAGDDRFGLRSAREAQVLRALLAKPRRAASNGAILQIWRELIGESLRIQGPMQVTVWGGRDPVRLVELARRRFGAAPRVNLVDTPELALAATKEKGGVAVLSLEPGSRWWGRLLVEQELSVFAALPELAVWGQTGALAVAELEVEPSGADETYWITDAPRSVEAIEEALGRDGVAARLICDGGGLKLFGLPGYFQRTDERLARAPGRLTGVIGAAPTQFDL
jgi:chorismate mutase